MEHLERDLKRRLRSNPRDAYALSKLGALAVRDYKDAKGETLLRRAIAAGASTSDPYCNLAVLLKRSDRLAEACRLLQSVRHNFENDQDFQWAWNFIFYRISTSKVVENSDLDFGTKDAHLLTMSIGLKSQVCDWSSYEQDRLKLIALVEEGVTLNPFFFIGFGVSAELESRCSTTYASRFSALTKLAYKHPTCRTVGRHLRIGYISADFREHALSTLISGMIEAHDRSRFEIFVYSTVYEVSAKAERIRAASDVFRDLSKISPRDAATLIYADRLDILVDMTGYADGGRPEILALRPAPIQINYLGFPGTMGASFIDYLIADKITAPPAIRAFCVEKVLDLDCFQPNDESHEISERSGTRAALGLPQSGVVLCSFAQAYKISPIIFATWMNILRRVPHAVLWLLAASQAMIDNLRSEASKRGINPARLRFAAKVSHDEHATRHLHADLVLDTFPVGAFTTASDALRAGLPLITCLGQTPAGRGAASILTYFGAPDLVTTSLDAYEELAVELALNEKLLGETKRKIRSLRRTSPLLNSTRHTRQIERLYEEVVAKRPL